MSDETHLERATDHHMAGRLAAAVGEIIQHLEQQTAPPEAAPERATRDEDYRRPVTWAGSKACQPWEPSPSAVQGEERTAAKPEDFVAKWGRSIGALCIGDEDFDVYLDAKTGEHLIRGYAWGKDVILTASSSPTATAQAEPGERPYVFTTPRKDGALYQPAPVPECTHNEVGNDGTYEVCTECSAIRLYQDGAPAYPWVEYEAVRRLLAPSLPTEGEIGPTAG